MVTEQIKSNFRDFPDHKMKIVHIMGPRQLSFKIPGGVGVVVVAAVVAGVCVVVPAVAGFGDDVVGYV